MYVQASLASPTFLVFACSGWGHRSGGRLCFRVRFRLGLAPRYQLLYASPIPSNRSSRLRSAFRYAILYVLPFACHHHSSPPPLHFSGLPSARRRRTATIFEREMEFCSDMKFSTYLLRMLLINTDDDKHCANVENYIFRSPWTGDVCLRMPSLFFPLLIFISTEMSR